VIFPHSHYQYNFFHEMIQYNAKPSLKTSNASNPRKEWRFFCYYVQMKWVIGIDEVGRGPLAGPVCVCAVAMPVVVYKKAFWRTHGSNNTTSARLISLTDSKQMTVSGRKVWERHAKVLQTSGTIRIGVSMRSAAMIDRRGISACIRSCISSTLQQLDLDPRDCTVLLDGGLKAPSAYQKQTTVIRGDSLHPIISLASVVAKVRRDRHMQLLHRTHAVYRWNENKGYGTLVHRTAIRTFGPSPIHRKSFISKVF
jgi:ribonuclease HII